MIESIHYEKYGIEKGLYIIAKIYTVEEIRRSSDAF